MWRIIFRASIDSGAVHQQNASWQAPRAGLARDVILCDGRLALARACWFYRRSLQVSFRSPLPKRTAFYVERLVTRLETSKQELEFAASYGIHRAAPSALVFGANIVRERLVYASIPLFAMGQILFCVASCS